MLLIFASKLLAWRRAMRVNQAWQSRAGMATQSPASVVTRASEMPSASNRASPTPTAVMRRNVWIMPVTVPSRPRSGAAVALTPSQKSRCSRRAIHFCATVNNSFSSASPLVEDAWAVVSSCLKSFEGRWKKSSNSLYNTTMMQITPSRRIGIMMTPPCRRCFSKPDCCVKSSGCLPVTSRIKSD